MLLDYRVVEKPFEIPHSYKCSHGLHAYSSPKDMILGDKKHILKELAYDYIPKEMLSGPKRGFGVPLAKWLRGSLKGEISRYSAPEYLRKQGLFDSDGVQRLIRTQEHEIKIIYSSILWSFYMFQRWWKEYC